MEPPCPPPTNFRAAVDVSYARFLPARPHFIKERQLSGRQKLGYRYERAVRDYLAKLLLRAPGVELQQDRWLEFSDRSGRRWCQTDAIVIDRQRGVGIIVEVKYQHTAEAWWQLKWLYEPVVAKALPGITWGLLEIVHWHDPQVLFPEPYQLTPNPLRIPKRGQVAVHIYNPGRLLPTRPGRRSAHRKEASSGGRPQGADGLPDSA